MPSNDKRRTITDVITPADVDRTNAASGTASWQSAVSLVPAYAASAGQDADDVASIARLYVAALLDKGHAASDAARMAVATARKSWHQITAQQSAGEAASLDTPDADGDPRDTLAQTTYPAPDAIAAWTMRDTLATVATLQDESERAICAALWSDADTWTDTGRVNVAALARSLYPDAERVPSGRARAALRTVVTDTLAALPALAYRVTNDYRIALPSTAPDRARDTLRDTTTPDAGPASAVVVTRPDGRRWLALPDVWHAVSDDGARAALATVDTLPAWHGERPATEETRAALAAPATLTPLRRPAGVSAGLRYGPNGAVASEAAYADARPTPSRKRKRDGGIGTSAVTGRTRVGYGVRGTAPASGARPVAAGPCACPACADADRRAALAAWRASDYADAHAPAATACHARG